MEAIRNAWAGTCAFAGGRLSPYLEGELGRLTRSRVRAHLDRCPRCRQVLASLSRSLEGLRELGRVEPPAGSVADAVVERVRREPRP